MSPVYAIAIILSAIGCAGLLSRFETPKPYKKYQSLDGLRGMAALFVFIHHAAVWYFYRITGNWDLPPSRLYTQLGQGGVAVFFMLTGFLFWGKIREDATPDWIRLYASRFMRITPLYYFTMIVLVLFALAASHQTHWTIRASAIAQLVDFYKVVDLFGVKDTYVINAGVTWTLPYEWLFYLMLPVFVSVLHPSARKRSALLASTLYFAVLVWLFRTYDLHSRMLMFFVYGILSYELYRSHALVRLKSALTGASGSALVAACSLLIVHDYNSAYHAIPQFLYFLIFLSISLGNTLFGLLDSRPLKLLGEISYSMYLLQGFFYM